MRQLVWPSLLCTVLAAGDGDGECKATGDGTCSKEQSALRWRGFPYQLRDPKFAHTIYGGSYVSSAFAQQGFEGPAEGEDWDVLWTHRSQSLHHLNLPKRSGSRLVNHCAYFRAAGDKCELHKHIERSRLPGHLKSFELNDAASQEAWRREVKSDPAKYWVFKPCGAGASRGIQVLKGADALAAAKTLSEKVVAQEYLMKPYMGFGYRKFHLRIYFFVPRWAAPVNAYLFDEGLIFRSHFGYDEKKPPSNARDVFSGISETVEVTPFAALWKQLSPDAVVSVQSQIRELFRDLLGSNLQESFGDFATSVQSRRRWECFDLFGADVILDENLKPWLMEINTGPNLWVSNHGAKHEGKLSAVKDPLMKQLLHWAKLRSRRESGLSKEDADDIEKQSLINFTRVTS